MYIMGNDNFQNKLLAVRRNLLNFAYTLTANRDDAYDLLQDTTLKALDNQDKYVSNVNFKGWIFTIMRNLFINKYRRQARAAVVVDHSDDLYIINLGQETASESPDGAYSAKEITSIIGTIPEELRRPFSMFVAGYRYAEIADKMDLPLGTVKSRIYMARQRLQKSLGEYRYD